MKRSVDFRVTIGLIVAAVTMGGTGYLFISAMNTSVQSNGWVTHTYTVISTVNSMYGDIRDAESLQRGFLLTADTDYLNQYKRIKTDAYSQFVAVRALTADNTVQQQNLLGFKRILDQRFDTLSRGIDLRGAGMNEAIAFVASGSGNRLMKQIDSSLKNILLTEQNLLTTRQQSATQSVRTIREVLIVLVLLALILLGGVYILFRRDISQRAKAESDRDRFFEVSPDLFFTLDKDQTIERANVAWETVLGWSPKELQNTEFVELAHPEDQARLSAILKDLKTKDIEFDGRFRRKDASYTWLEVRGRNFREEGISFGNARDITLRREAEAEMRTMNERLQSSNRELESFASVASHDLQEPLRKIQSFADILTTRYAEGVSEQASGYIAKMAQAATRMRLLIDNMLGYSRLTSRAQEIEPVDLRECVNGVISDLEIAIESKQATIDIGELPIVEADKFQMQQLFQNLISNALKFQKPGAKPVVSIHERTPTAAEGSATNTKNVVILVKDNGIGFAQEYETKVFGMFQRLHGRNEYEGTGIGLAVCQKIVERHNGQISVRSVVGEGTTFEITLPRKSQSLPAVS